MLYHKINKKLYFCKMKNSLGLFTKTTCAGHASIYLNKKMICEGNNTAVQDEPTMHAIVATLQTARLSSKRFYLSPYQIVIDAKPCAMCATAILQARMDKVQVAGKEQPIDININEYLIEKIR